MNDIAYLRDVCHSLVPRFLPGETLQSLEPATSGFSGAVVVKVGTGGGGKFALRGWPRGETSVDRLRELHRWMRFLQENGLPVSVPCTCPGNGSSLIERDNRLWQLEPWLSGDPPDEGLCDAAIVGEMMRTLARLHEASARYVPTASGAAWFHCGRGACPAVLERRRVISDWTPMVLRDARDLLRGAPEDFRRPALESLECCRRFAAAVDDRLRRCERWRVVLHPCWRDLWREHVLLAGGRVSGLIDPSAARTDHPATDLTRLLGSLYPSRRNDWSAPLHEYAKARSLSQVEHELIVVLDLSAVLLSPLNWVNRWKERRIPTERMTEVAARLQWLVDRQQSLADV